jgi:WD40 repeat protein
VTAPPFQHSWEAHLGDHVVRLAWSPNGQMLAAAMVGGPIALFAAGGAFLRELPGHQTGTLAISWSADSQLLASGGQDGAARIWDAQTGNARCQLDAGAQWVEQVAFSPQQDRLATGAGRHLKLWSSDGRLLQSYAPHPSTITDIAWQPGELFFATAAYGQLANFHSDKPEPVRVFEWKGSILVIAWSPDGNYIATGNQDASVHFWYRKSGRDLEMSGYPAKVRELSWDSSSRYLATGGAAVVCIWDCGGKGPAGTRPGQLDAHENLLSAVAFQHKGRLLASGCRSGDLFLWNPKKPDAPLRGAQFEGGITQIRWAPDDTQLATSSETGLVRVFQRIEKG